jgi:hypothetical protein
MNIHSLIRDLKLVYLFRDYVGNSEFNPNSINRRNISSDSSLYIVVLEMAKFNIIFRLKKEINDAILNSIS